MVAKTHNEIWNQYQFKIIHRFSILWQSVWFHTYHRFNRLPFVYLFLSTCHFQASSSFVILAVCVHGYSNKLNWNFQTSSDMPTCWYYVRIGCSFFIFWMISCLFNILPTKIVFKQIWFFRAYSKFDTHTCNIVQTRKNPIKITIICPGWYMFVGYFR